MVKPVRLALVRDERKRAVAKSNRAVLFGEIRKCLDRMGDDLSGYAFASWRTDGSLSTAVQHGVPFGRSLPEIVRDALNQHIAADTLES